LPRSDANSLKGTRRKKKLEKISASELRFKEQFVGRYIKKENNFKGACFDLRLVRVKTENECFVTLSDFGKEFAMMDNPILDEGKHEANFSNEEVKFITQKIITRFNLEDKITRRILKELEKKNMSSEEIDDIFKEEWLRHNIQKQLTKETMPPITSERVATMGRLAELKMVKWDIISGKSEYSLR